MSRFTAYRAVALTVLALILAACAGRGPLSSPEPLRGPAEETPTAPEQGPEKSGADADAGQRQRVRRLFSPPKLDRAMADLIAEVDVPTLPGPPLALNVRDMPLPTFIHHVFGDLLGLDFVLDPSLREQNDLVTLRISEPIERAQLFENVLEVLSRYGVAVARSNNLLTFLMDPDYDVGDLPIVITGDALPEVPATHRPLFQVVQLNYISPGFMRTWLRDIFGNRLETSEVQEQNVVILEGSPSVVGNAVAAIEALDRPSLRGRNVLRIDPAYRTADDLAGDVVDALNAQGINANTRSTVGGVAVLPMAAINAIFVFAADEEALQHARRWAEELDVLPDRRDEESNWYTYSVRNTSVTSIAPVFERLFGQVVATGFPEQADTAQQPGRSTAQPRRGSSGSGGSGGVVIDEERNLLFFRGNFDEWQQARDILQTLDQAARMVLIEVTIAEVTLTDETRYGVEWALRNASIGGFGGPLSFVEGEDFGLPGSGVSYSPISSSGQTRAIIDLFARDDKVSILSSPRIMVRSGQEATIDVGTEIPIITQSASAPDFGDGEGDFVSLQEIMMRKTGVLLTVLPIVHADSRIDLEVRQEVSEAVPTETSGINSPSIFERSVDTNLSLRDGGSVLLGGLISENRSKGGTRVPVLGSIPLLGRLFRTDSSSSQRTELLVMITPYIVRDQDEAEELSRAFREQLRFHDKP